ncbi:MAG: 16S rRNA (cytidine(1402)-2'-O)-methyltransferase [Dehalococcoidia bacterium]
MPVLYLVATPIGNLEDVTLRALRVLREVGLIAAEDTRTTRKLLSRYGIRNRLLSYNDHNKPQRIPHILATLEEKDVALVSEAGMPAISDPGYDLVVAAGQVGVSVVPVPGPSAVVTALAVSGLPTRRFTYVGFLPRRQGERRRALTALAHETATIVALESPHRLLNTLTDMLAAWGDRRVAVCRELTKAHEEVFRGRLSEAIEYFQEPRGEFTLVVEGAASQEAQAGDLKAELRRLRRQGLRAREAVSQLAAKYGCSHRSLYRLWLELGQPTKGSAQHDDG